MCKSRSFWLLIACCVACACCGCGSRVKEEARADPASSASVQPNPNVDAQSDGDDFWKGLERHEIQLEETLLLVKGSRGVAACPYLDIDMFTRTGEACVIIPAAKIDGMLDSRVKAVTPKAKELGIEVGMSGREALEKIR